MNKLNDFDLDIKASTNNPQPTEEIFSFIACTPGTCHASCEHGSTFYTDCCKIVQATTQTVSLAGGE